MSRKGPFIVFRVIGFLLLTALFIGGGFMAYKAGVAQGISEAPAVATAIAQAAESGQSAPVPPMMYGHGYGYGNPMMYGRHHFGFVPFGICGSIFFLFLFFGFMKMIFFRGMRHGWGRHGHHGHWGKDWEGGLPPKFNEWHKRAHGETPAEEGNEGDKKE
ncbi:MAG: hypothetical protein IPL71_17475 [Anaerolineales bacterium]|uniref:hypothetical protein n=1 Tax=Candidatus Villigracilis proximus TaxID=3140683 RepID=UPI0031353FB5|nr:hypothetical protein [Anaerolineales bacterium]